MNEIYDFSTEDKPTAEDLKASGATSVAQTEASKPEKNRMDLQGYALCFSLVFSGVLLLKVAFTLLIAGAITDPVSIGIAAFLFVVSCGFVNVGRDSSSIIWSVIAGLGVLWVRAFIAMKFDVVIIDSHWVAIAPVMIAIFSPILSRESLSNRSS